MSATTKVGRQDIRKIILDNFNNTEIRFSNDGILEHLNQMDRYSSMELDVLDLEDLLLEMERSGLLRPIAQNFNTRYYRLGGVLEPASCKRCGLVSYFSSIEDEKPCPQCGTGL
jgi:predicted Zn-ribbon and HTH transcriptional regulator